MSPSLLAHLCLLEDITSRLKSRVSPSSLSAALPSFQKLSVKLISIQISKESYYSIELYIVMKLDTLAEP